MDISTSEEVKPISVSTIQIILQNHSDVFDEVTLSKLYFIKDLQPYVLKLIEDIKVEMKNVLEYCRLNKIISLSKLDIYSEYVLGRCFFICGVYNSFDSLKFLFKRYKPSSEVLIKGIYGCCVSATDKAKSIIDWIFPKLKRLPEPQKLCGYAIQSGKREFVDYIREYIFTPYNHTKDFYFLQKVCRSGNLELVKELIGESMIPYTSSVVCLDLTASVKSRNLNLVKYILELPPDFHIIRRRNMNLCLEYVFENSLLDILKLLIDNSDTHDLTKAFASGNMEIVEYVLGYCKDKNLQLSIDNGFSEACRGGNIEIIKMLISFGAKDYCKGLWICAKHNHLEGLKLMLSLGARVYDKAFYEACMFNSYDTAICLYELGVSNVNLIYKEYDYDTVCKKSKNFDDRVEKLLKRVNTIAEYI